MSRGPSGVYPAEATAGIAFQTVWKAQDAHSPPPDSAMNASSSPSAAVAAT